MHFSGYTCIYKNSSDCEYSNIEYLNIVLTSPESCSLPTLAGYVYDTK